MEQEHDLFVRKGRFNPGTWLKDERKKVLGYSPNKGLEEVKEEYVRRSTMNLHKYTENADRVTNIHSELKNKPKEDSNKFKLLRSVVRRF